MSPTATSVTAPRLAAISHRCAHTGPTGARRSWGLTARAWPARPCPWPRRTAVAGCPWCRRRWAGGRQWSRPPSAASGLCGGNRRAVAKASGSRIGAPRGSAPLAGRPGRGRLTGGGKEGFTLGKRRDFLHDQVVHTTITQEGSHVLSQTMSSDGTDPDAVLAAPAPSPAAWPRLGGLWHDPGPERLPHGRRSRLAGPGERVCPPPAFARGAL